MKGIIATRFSSARQIGGTSTETQLEVCEDYCRREGIEVIGYHKVEAESAKSSNVARIAELAKERGVDVNVLLLNNIKELLKKYSADDIVWEVMKNRDKPVGVILSSKFFPTKQNK